MEVMERYTFRIQSTLLKDVEDKAGIVPTSRIIRSLLEKWVKGEVKLDYESKIELQQKGENS